MMNLKVGVMPGKLQEVVVENGVTAREIFEVAEIVVSNHEVRLDGNVISLDDCVHNGKLLVAMKQIKGNARTIKVGIMPGKLQEIEVTGQETAKDLFEMAGITLSNHEIRLDGNVIGEYNTINDGKLLVAMKQIKGNNEVYTTSLDEDEIMYLLTHKLPQVLDRDRIEEFDDDMLLIDDEYLVEKDMFFSVYEEGYVHEDEMSEEQHECKCKNAVEVIERRIELIKEDLEYYDKMKNRLWSKLEELESVLNEIQ